MTVKAINHDQLAAIRKSAPRQTILTVSRPARRNISPKTYQGTGNVHSLVKSLFPDSSNQELKYISERVLRYAETKNSGIIPDAYTIKNLV